MDFKNQKNQWIKLPFQVRYGNTSSQSHAEKEEVSSSSVTKDIKKSSSQGEVKTENSFSDKKESGLSIKTDNELEAAMEGTFSLGKRIGNQLMTNHKVSPASQDAAKEVFEGAAIAVAGVVAKVVAKKRGGAGEVLMDKTGDLAMAAGTLKVLKVGQESNKRLDNNGDLRNIEGSGDDPKHLGNSPMEEETIETVFLLALSTVSMVFSLILNNAPDGSGPFTYLYLFLVICIFTIVNYLYVGIFKLLAKIFSDTKKNEKETSGKK
jgi:hypothetical protein